MIEVESRVPATEQLAKTHRIRIFTVNESNGSWRDWGKMFDTTAKAIQWLRKNGDDNQRYEIVRLCKSVKVNVQKVRKLS